MDYRRTLPSKFIPTGERTKRLIGPTAIVFWCRTEISGLPLPTGRSSRAGTARLRSFTLHNSPACIRMSRVWGGRKSPVGCGNRHKALIQSMRNASMRILSWRELSWFIALAIVAVGCDDKSDQGSRKSQTKPQPKRAVVDAPREMTQFEFKGGDATGGLNKSWQAVKWSSRRFRPNATFSKHESLEDGPGDGVAEYRYARRLGAEVVKQFKKKFGGSPNVKYTIVEKVGSLNMMICEVEHTVQNIPLIQMQAHTYVGRDHYMLIMTAAQSEWRDWQPRFQSFYRSFRVVDE